MKKIIESILKHNVIILIISFLIVVLGVYSYIEIPKQEMPEIEAEVGIVQIIAPGLNSEEISERIVEPVEDIMNEYSTVKAYTTTSLDNACVIVIEMNLSDSNASETLEKIRNDIAMAKLDDSITDMDFILDLSAGEVIYAIHSDSLSEYELEKTAKDLVIYLKGIDHIANAKVNSAYQEEIVVNINLDTLNTLPITTLDVYNVLYANGYEIPLGITEYEDVDTSIRINSNYNSMEEIRDIILFANETGIVKIGDIATVSLEDAVNKKTYIFNGYSSVFVEVFFDEDIDYTVLGEDLEDKVAKLKGDLSSDISITPMTFSPKHVQRQVDDIMKNLVLCIVIVMFVVLVGLGFRNALSIAVTIPTIVLGTISILYMSGSHLQLISIAGLIVSIGVLVDNSIVISEAAQHGLNEGLAGKEACVQAVKQNYLPVLASTLTTIAAFVPLLFLPGIAGDVAFTLPLTILLAISISYIISITLTPILAQKIFKAKKVKEKRIKKKRIKQNKESNWIENALESIFKMAIPITFIAFLLLGFLAYRVYQTQEIDILPKTEKSIVYIDYEYEVINDKSGTKEFAKEIESVVARQEDVINYAYSQGGDLPKFDLIQGAVNELPHLGRFFIEYDCDSNDLEDYMSKLDLELELLKENGDISVNRLELSRPEAPVQIVLTSNDFEHLYTVSNDIFENVKELESYKDGRLVSPNYKADIEVLPNRDLSTQYGLTMVEIEQQIALNLNGLSESLYDDGEKVLNVRLNNTVDSVEELKELQIKSQTGQSIALRDLAEIQEIESLEFINSYNGVPSVTLDAYMADGYSTYELEQDIKTLIDLKADSQIDVIYKGDNELTNELMQGMIIAFLIAIIVIYLIMYVQFKTLRQPLLILVSIPLSFIGSLVAMLIFGEKITLTSLLGIVSLTGIVVNNGILLVDYINKSREDGEDILTSCIMAVKRRLRPILLTSATTILGLIPLALYGGDFFRPMAVTLMGGLFTSTLFVLFVIPGLYYVTYKRKYIIIVKEVD